MLQALHKVKQVWTNLSLIIDHCHLVTTNSKVPCYMNTNFSFNDNNAMHNFYNLTYNTIIPMFLGCLSKNWNNVFISKWVRGQKWKKCNKLFELPFLLSNHIPHNHYFCHYVYFPIVEQVFMFCMLWSYRHVILFYVVIISYNLVFAPSNILIEVVKFRNQKLFSPFNLCANMTPTHVHFLIGTNHKFCPWKLCCPDILKILINFPFSYHFLFFLH